MCVCFTCVYVLLPGMSRVGLMLDVARHYIPVELILRTIETMGAAKLNVLHLHLTDSQVVE